MQYITGASGFLGTHLSKKIGKAKKVPHEEISSLKLHDFDKFFFLSAYGNMHFHTEDEKIIKANVTDLVDVIIQVPHLKFNSFVFMSTSSVNLPVQTMYSRTKKAAEEILLSVMEKYDLPICIIRPFSITGKGEQKEHLIPVLIDSCFNGSPVRLDLAPRHDFIDVEDVVDGMIALSKNKARGIFELGTGKSYTNEEVWRLVEKVTGRKANVESTSRTRAYDTTDWVSRNFKARSFVWTPKVSLEDSIRKQVQNYNVDRT